MQELNQAALTFGLSMLAAFVGTIAIYAVAKPGLREDLVKMIRGRR